MVLVVARELGMSPGKVGAQCAHAAVGLYKRLAAQRAPWLRAWEVVTSESVNLFRDSLRRCSLSWLP